MMIKRVNDSYKHNALTIVLGPFIKIIEAIFDLLIPLIMKAVIDLNQYSNPELIPNSLSSTYQASILNYAVDLRKYYHSFNKNYIESIEFNKLIAEHRKLPADKNKILYEKGQKDLPIPILEKDLFDLDNMLEEEKDKDNNDYTGNQQSFDRIAHFLQIQKEKMEV